jgi:hypothetical protein
MIVEVEEDPQPRGGQQMENWTDYTDTLAADDSDALAALAEVLPNLPEPDDEGGAAPLAAYAEPLRVLSAEPLDSPFFI